MDGKAVNDIQSNISSSENSSSGISTRNYLQIYPRKLVIFDGKAILHEVRIKK